MCSILKKGEVEDVDNVGAMYDLLLPHYAGDTGKATDALCVVLDAVHHRSLSSSSDILDLKEFQWRLKMMECADEAKKQGKRTVHYLNEKLKLEISSDDTFSSPIGLFEHMIETDKLKVGEAEDLKIVEEATISLREWKYRVCSMAFCG
jgi:hypothetical protein